MDIFYWTPILLVLFYKSISKPSKKWDSNYILTIRDIRLTWNSLNIFKLFTRYKIWKKSSSKFINSSSVWGEWCITQLTFSDVRKKAGRKKLPAWNKNLTDLCRVGQGRSNDYSSPCFPWNPRQTGTWSFPSYAFLNKEYSIVKAIWTYSCWTILNFQYIFFRFDFIPSIPHFCLYFSVSNRLTRLLV